MTLVNQPPSSVATRPSSQLLPTGPRSANRDALLLTAVAFLVGFAFSWYPSIWYDEAATIASATRPWPALWAMLQNVDAVHAVYYVGMHLWFDVVGYSPLTLRLPSVLAAAATVGLTVMLTGRLAGRRTALLAGIVLLLIPRMAWASGEGRSYALTALLAVASTFTVVLALRLGSTTTLRRRRDARSRLADAALWLLYAALTAFSIAVFAYLALVVVAHLVTVIWLLRARRLTGRAAAGFAVAAGAALTAMIPFLLSVASQSGQVGWIPPVGAGTVASIVTTQFFPSADLFAAVGLSLAGVGVVVLLARARRGGAIRTVRNRDATGAPDFLAVVLPFLVVPTAGLVLASVVVSPLYSPRYLTFSAPAVAVLIAAALTMLRSNRLLAVSVVVLVLLAVPTIGAQRTAEAKQESSWSEVAATISQTDQNTQLGRTGVLYGRVAGHPTATQRVVKYAYPRAFEGLADPTLVTPVTESDHLWETQVPVTAAQLVDLDTVWTISSERSRVGQAATTSTLISAGFRETARWHFSRVDVALYRR